MMLTMRLTNFEQVRRGHEHFLAENSRLILESLERAGRHAKDHVNKYPEFTPRTGNLQKKTTARVVRTKGGRVLKLDNKAEYADAIDGGARPHVITAKSGGFLRFFWAKHRKWVMARKVNHPGNRAYRFMYRAWNSAGRMERQELERGMREIASRF